MPAWRRRLVDAVLAPDEDGLAETLVDEGQGGADHLLLLALGEDHALRELAHALEDAVERAGDRIAPGGELRLVGAHVDDGPARDARIHGGLRHRHRDRVDQARIEGHGDDVFAPEARTRALIGRGDLVGHVLAGELRQRLGGRDLHLHVDRGRLHVERAAEDVGKAQNVVDLVRVVGAAGGDDHVVADAGHLFRRDFRIGIGHGEDDRVRRHGADHLVREGALRREAEHRIRAVEGIRQGAGARSRPHGPISTGSCPRCGPGRSRPWCRRG